MHCTASHAGTMPWRLWRCRSPGSLCAGAPACACLQHVQVTAPYGCRQMVMTANVKHVHNHRSLPLHCGCTACARRLHGTYSSSISSTATAAYLLKDTRHFSMCSVNVQRDIMRFERCVSLQHAAAHRQKTFETSFWHLKQACWRLWKQPTSCTGGPLWRPWQCRQLSCCGWRPRCWPLLDSPPWCASSRHPNPKLESYLASEMLRHRSEMDTRHGVRPLAVATVRQRCGLCI